MQNIKTSVSQHTKTARTRLIACILLPWIISACTQSPMDTSLPISTQTYVCSGTDNIRVKWWDTKVEVEFKNQIWVLPHALSASGARYSDGQKEVWEHQGVLRISDGASEQNCRKIQNP